MKNDFIHVRVNGELKQEAKEYAKETGRTLAGLIEYLLKKELKKGDKKMRTWYILEYDNGNRAIFEEDEYLKEMQEQYGVDPTSLMYCDEFIAGVVESETEPTWNDLIYDEETRMYFLKNPKSLKIG